MFEKPKRKRDAQPGLSRYFRRTLPFEFVAVYSLEECADRLTSRATPHRLFKSALNPIINIDVSPVNADVYQFAVHKQQHRQTNLYATGSMERVGATSTVVRGTIVQREVMFVNILLILALFLVTGPLAPFILIWFILRRYQRKLEILDLISSSLGATPNGPHLTA